MKTLTVILNSTLIIALAVVPIIFSINKIENTVWAIIGVFLALFFVNIERFEWIKLTFLEAKLQKTIKEAYAVLDDLKELGLSISEPMIANLAVSGRMLQYITLEYKLESVEKISKTLRKLGANDEEINEVCESIHQRVEADHCRVLLYNLKTNDEKGEELFKDFQNWKFSQWDKDKILDFAKENKLEFSEDAHERLEDLEYFLKTKKLRRPDKWQS